MIVVDASIVTVALIDDGPDGAKVRAALSGQALVAPELIDLEVLSVLRRQVRARAMTVRRAELALVDLADLPMKRATHRSVLARCWELRASVTAYDAAYVALAEALEVPLVTADRRLARSPGIRCPVEVIS